ncbi:hypothetical protein [Aeromicrobium choanae]|uniref:Uncharacterized protein n=1 Tax=Aeromicrobium choanae TaxID=1736691 RepID=A0A1T4YMT6_9ACTN|nr:hypothetical protein [Aeromicrobium choanae]SKB02993.1 hypothetical protein SAMN06295964_0114 [Aeromicrobium choanae]
MSRRHAPMRAIALVAALVAVLLGPAAPALADVAIDEVLPQGNGTSVLVVTVEGGCESSTTGLALELPEDTSVIDATGPDGWNRVLDGRRIEFAGPGLPPAQVTEFLLTSRIGAESGEFVTVAAEQRCEGVTDAVRSEPRFEVTAEAVDPRMTVREPPRVSPGADSAQVALVIAVFVLAVAYGAVSARRRTARR